MRDTKKGPPAQADFLFALTFKRKKRRLGKNVKFKM